MINPNWLKTFKTLIDTGHFTKTADVLFMTQPGVSQQIRKLEESCGHALIRRINKTFEITEQGKLVYEYACQQALNEQNLFTKLSDNDPFSGRYQLACSGSLALHLYPKLLALQSQHPGLTVEVEAAPNQRILALVLQGEADAGIVTHVPNQSLLSVEVIGQEPLLIVVPKGCKVAGDIAKTLLSLGLISHPDAEHYLSLFLSNCAEPNLASLDTGKIKISGYVNQINQILLPVSLGLGFTLLPQSAVASFIEQDRIDVYRPPSMVYETLYLIRKRSMELSQRVQFLNQEVRKAISH